MHCRGSTKRYGRPFTHIPNILCQCDLLMTIELRCLHPFSCRLTFRSVNRRHIWCSQLTPCERPRPQADIYCCANKLDPFASISSRHCPVLPWHIAFIRLLHTPTPAARTDTAQVTLLRNLTETVGSHSGEHEHAILWDVTPCSIDKHVSDEPTLLAQERALFSKLYVNLYQAKQAHIPKGRNTQQKTHTFTNRSSRFVPWDTVAVLVNTAQNVNALETHGNLNYT